jgi:hypothetical protein
MNKIDEQEVNELVIQNLSNIDIFKKLKHKYNLEEQVSLLEKINQLNDVIPNQIIISKNFINEKIEQNFYSIVFLSSSKHYRVYAVTLLDFLSLIYELRTTIKSRILYKSTVYFFNNSSDYRELNKFENTYLKFILKILKIRQN